MNLRQNCFLNNVIMIKDSILFCIAYGRQEGQAIPPVRVQSL